MVIERSKALLRSMIPNNAYEHLRLLYWNLWDAWHGVETSGIVDVSSLNVVGNNQAHGYDYIPSGNSAKVFPELGIDYRQYALVDLGSGKGRALLLAAAFPFKSVEGVEFSVELHAIAEKNIQQYRFGPVRCSALKSILADATEFQFPATPVVILIANPFSAPVLSAVIKNIRKSAAENPRDILIIAAGSLLEREGFDSIPDVEVVWRRKYEAVYRLH
jgi:hypothetical protein